MRRLLPVWFVLAGLTLLVACSRGGGVASPIPSDDDPLIRPELAPPQALQHASGAQESALGLFELCPNREAPLESTLQPLRAGQNQGDAYLLSLRPLLGDAHLRLVNVVLVNDAVTEYTLEFRHPFFMPGNLERPATATKRVDLFLFDAAVTLVTEGNDTFFGGEVTADLDLLAGADGYRQIGPLLDLAGLGIAESNVFPYKLLSAYDAAAPAGNYDALMGWQGEDLRTASGYDVVPQGAIRRVTLRLPASLATPLPVVVLAKYMDPRAGDTAPEKRANRLPDPANPSALLYYLPEAAGDLQRIEAGQSNALLDNAPTPATLQVRVLDWDNAAPVATAFPDPTQPTHVRQSSGVSSVAVDFPELRSGEPFAASDAGTASGLINEWRTLNLQIWNEDQTLVVPEGGLVETSGLVRVRDQQDVAPDALILLDETLAPVTRPPGYEPSTRYQHVRAQVASSSLRPIVTGVLPAYGIPQQEVTFATTWTGGAPATMQWNFGGGAVPNTVEGLTPTVHLWNPGEYHGTVQAENSAGLSAVFPFTLEVRTKPRIEAVYPEGAAGFETTEAVFFAETSGYPPTRYDWHFGSGATPEFSREATPTVTLGPAGSYSGSLQVVNRFGVSLLYEFSYSTAAAVPPEIESIEMFGSGRETSFMDFSAVTTGFVETYAWNFGGGGIPNTSALPEPQIQLRDPGEYTGSLIVSNQFGTSPPFLFDYEVFETPPPPEILSVDPTGFLGLPGEQVVFHAEASGDPFEWDWDFDSGTTPGGGSQQTVLVTLRAPGTYQGNVVASSAWGDSAPFFFEYIVGNTDVPVIEFVNPTGLVGPSNATRTFEASVLNDPTAYSWNFGGAATPNTSTDPVPVVTLAAAGTYQASLVATNDAGDSDPFNFELVVRPQGAGGWAGVIAPAILNEASGVVTLDCLELPSGDALFLGEQHAMVDFDPTAGRQVISDATLDDMFLLQISSTGNYVGIKKWRNCLPAAMSRKANGDLVIAGDFDGTVDFDPDPGATQNRTGGTHGGHFILTLNPSLAYLDVFTWNAGSGSTLDQLAVDVAGNTWYGGVAIGLVDFDPGAGTDNHGEAGLYYVTKLGPGYSYGWSRLWNGDNVLEFSGLAVDTTRGPRISGSFRGTVDFVPTAAGGEHTAGGLDDGYLFGLTQAGALDFSSTLRGTTPQSRSQMLDVAVNSGGNVIGGGWFVFTVDVDPGAGTNEVDATSDGEGMLWSLTPTGGLALAQLFGGASGSASITDIALGPAGEGYLMANMSGQPDLDPGAGVYTVVSQGDPDVALIKLQPSGSFMWGGSIGGANSENGRALWASSQAVLAAGLAWGVPDLDPGPGESIHHPATFNADFLLRLDSNGDL